MRNFEEITIKQVQEGIYPGNFPAKNSSNGIWKE